MKRTVTLFILFGVLMALFCGCENTKPDNTSTESQLTAQAQQESQLATQTEQESQKTAEKPLVYALPESLAEKLVRQMDEDFEADSKLPEYTSTAGMCQLYDKYTKKWQQVADEYYNKIMAFDDLIQPSEIYYSAEDLHTFVANMKTNWEAYNQEQCANYLKTLQAIYQGGTIVGPLIANYECNQYKEWALQLVAICQDLYII